MHYSPIRISTLLAAILLPLNIHGADRTLAPADVSVLQYQSIQEAIDANPGRTIRVPSGDYVISKALTITTDHTGLSGHGRIIQSNPEEKIIEIQKASGVQLHDLTLTRQEGKMETLLQGIHAVQCSDLIIDGVRVINNRTRRHAILLEYCDTSQIRNCLIQDYMRIAVDDRTADPGWGAAFNVIHGSGISVRSGRAILVQGNRIIENNLIPTPELKAKYHLGEFIKRNSQKGDIVPQKIWDAQYYNAWQQGSAIECRIVNVPGKPYGADESDCTQIIGNYIQNAAQGIDVHGDHVIVANNIVNDAYLGIKTMHGSSKVVISDNQFLKIGLWGIYLAPGALAVPAKAAEPGGVPTAANPQSGTIIANNIISDFGFGNSAWIWKGDDLGCYPIRFDKGQKSGLLPISDVLVQGNVVYDTGRDGILIDGKPQVAPPRYAYTVWIPTDADVPQGLHFVGNIFHPGTKGIANVELKP